MNGRRALVNDACTSGCEPHSVTRADTDERDWRVPCAQATVMARRSAVLHPYAGWGVGSSLDEQGVDAGIREQYGSRDGRDGCARIFDTHW